jgi:hypothetical protein
MTSSFRLAHRAHGIGALATLTTVLGISDAGHAQSFSPAVNDHVGVAISRSATTAASPSPRRIISISPAVNGQVSITIPLPERDAKTAKQVRVLAPEVGDHQA